MSGAQAPLARVPLADGTLVATPEIPPEDLIPSLAGAIRINATDYVADTILWPKLKPLLCAHREIHLEIAIDYAMSDNVALGFDAGVRIGAEVAKDMIAARIGTDFRFVVVGSPSYFKRRAPPKAPADLTDHACINLRLNRAMAGKIGVDLTIHAQFHGGGNPSIVAECFSEFRQEKIAVRL